MPKGTLNRETTLQELTARVSRLSVRVGVIELFCVFAAFWLFGVVKVIVAAAVLEILAWCGTRETTPARPPSHPRPAPVDCDTALRSWPASDHPAK